MVSIDETLNQMKEQMEKTKKILEEREVEFENLMKTHFHSSLWKSIRKEEILPFVKKPYTIQPYREGEWRLFVPRFIPLEVGWLEYQDFSFNIFRVNKYVDWITPIPEILKDELGIEKPEFDLSFDWEKSVMNVDKGDVNKVKKKYGKFIHRQLNHTTFQIKSPQRFSFIIELIKDGILPFKPNPANPDDFYEEERANFGLRDYQKQAWDTFLKYSHIGIFYPFGAGKTVLGIYAVSKIKGLKLIVVPTLTLKEKWEKDLVEKISEIDKNEFVVTTYQSATKDSIRRKEYSLVCFDEVHHLPSNVYSLFSFIKRRYTIGLSGSPFREDSRSELIFALTGHPIGADWNYFWKKGIVKKPKVSVIVVKGFNEKIFELDRLLKEKSITLVYCDTIQKGKIIASKFNGTFVFGASKKRLNIIGDALNERGWVVLSRIGDEGISLPEVQRVIEFDFLFGSRRQEAQRVGRLFHSAEEGEHIILMTGDEFSNYKKRLYGIMEKGIEVEVINKMGE